MSALPMPNTAQRPPSMLTDRLKTCGLPVIAYFNGVSLEVGDCVKSVGHKDRCTASRFALERR
jgi:hypothetical protein